MDKYKKKFLIAVQLCSIVLLGLFVAAPVGAQASELAAATTTPSSLQIEERHIIPPPVPANLRVSDGEIAFLEGHGVGTQNYVCRPSGSGFAFVLFTPAAILFKDNDRQLTSHFFSPNPFEANTDPKTIGDRPIRATWVDSRDTSTVWAKVNQPSTDPAFVAQGAVAWLLLDVVGAQEGPTGGKTLTPAVQIQRVNTSGGLAPSTGCASSADVGNQAFVPYTADYIFYKKAR